MITTNRRRQFGAEKAPEIEYPDAFKIVFIGNANTSYSVGYHAIITHYILDGVEVYPTNAVSSVKPITNGRHTLYFWINANDRLANGITLRYLRIPANNTYWHSSFLWTSWGLEQIDFLGATPPTLASDFGACNGTPKITVRVPVGSLDSYTTALDKTALKRFIKEIIETKDFTYN